MEKKYMLHFFQMCIRDRTQPFTEPMSIPFMKYFCTKGYTHRIGMIVKMMIAICSVNGCARSSIAVAD